MSQRSNRGPGYWARTDPTVATRGQQTVVSSARICWKAQACVLGSGREAKSFNYWGPITQRGGDLSLSSPLLNGEVLLRVLYRAWSSC